MTELLVSPIRSIIPLAPATNPVAVWSNTLNFRLEEPAFRTRSLEAAFETLMFVVALGIGREEPVLDF
jgi:hypothetical protein